MISSYLGSYKSIVKHNGYILEDTIYSITTKDIAFQAIIIYPMRHDTICIYEKHPMYLSRSQVRRERTDHHAPSTKEGPSMIKKKKKKGASTVNRKEERLSDKRKKVSLDEMKKGVHPYGKRGGHTLPLL
jgi:hypothetical protein